MGPCVRRDDGMIIHGLAKSQGNLAKLAEIGGKDIACLDR
jgi:hypothetical protein